MKMKINEKTLLKKYTLVPSIRRGAVVCTMRKKQGTVDANGIYIYVLYYKVNIKRNNDWFY